MWTLRRRFAPRDSQSGVALDRGCGVGGRYVEEDGVYRVDNEGNPNGKGFNGEWMEFDQNEVRAGRMLATPVTQNESSAALDSLSLTGS